MPGNTRILRLPGWRDPRLPFIATLLVYITLGITLLGFNRSPAQIAIILIATCTLDVFLHRVLKGAWLFPLSAAITGLSLGILVNYAHGLWLPLVPVFFAIASKYVFTFKGRHVINPSLFGIVASLALAEGMISASPAYQWGGGAAMAVFIVTLALVLFVLRIKRTALIVSFLVFYALALALRAWVLRHHIPPETLFLGTLSAPAFYLFTFFMITDPATSPDSRRGQILMALFIVVVDLVLHMRMTLSTLFYAAFAYYALRLIALHARALWQRRDDMRTALAKGGMNLGVVSLIAGLGWTGYTQALVKHDTREAGFTLVRLDPAHTGIAGRPGQVLQDVDPRLQHVAKWLLSVGDAVAVADFDNDGLQDIFLTHPLKHPEDRAALYRNLGELRFERLPLPALDAMREHPEQAGLPSGALWLDYDNDKDQDLLITAGYGKSLLLQNRLIEEGTPRFVDVSRALGIDAYTISLAANALDMDRDGRLDLLIANAMNPWLPGYDAPTPFNVFKLPAPAYEGDRRMLNVMHRSWFDAANGGKNIFYKNTGNKFERIDLASIGLEGQRWTLDIGTGDLNADGWTDLYLANDFGPDQLYLNQKGQGFTSLQGHLAGQLGRDTYKGMNASLGDVDGNGALDIYVSNVHEPLQAEGSLLWLNNGQADTQGHRAFIDAAAARGALNPQRFGWGGAMGDMDRDARLDILQANGMVDNSYDPLYEGCPDYWYWNEKIALTGPDIHGYADSWADLRGRCIFPYERNRILLNRGSYFEDVAEHAGWSAKGNARGIALADLDNDGDLDVVLTHQFQAAEVFRNDGQARRWIGLELQGNATTCNRDALGTRVVLSHGENKQLREVRASNGFSAQGDRRLLFGLGDWEGPVSVQINWCGENDAQTRELDTGRYHRIVQRSLED